MSQDPPELHTRRLCDWQGCSGCASRCEWGDDAAALDWLRDCKADLAAMLGLRRTADELDIHPRLVGLPDDELVTRLSGLIVSGQLRVCGDYVPGGGGALRGGGGDPSPPAPPPQPKPPTPKPPPPKPKPVVKVTVKIVLSAPVACPGHPLPIKAVGSPGGGTYAWSLAGGTNAALTDGAGKALTTGADVNLRGFKANDATGAIPAQACTLTVTYTHPDGTATDSKPVNIHKIDFTVTNTNITGGVTQVVDQAGQAFFGNAPGVATMATNPKVKIKLDATCPRKAACAANHRVGWLQTMLTTDLRIRYTNTLISWAPPPPPNPAMPIRDSFTNAPVFPFYSTVTPFTADNDEHVAHHEDSPGNFGVAWTDPRPGAAAPPPATRRQLQRVTFKDSFTAWLVVQNIEWGTHDLPGSLAYQRHFNWSCSLDFAVDTSVAPAAGGGSNRCNPVTNPATISAMVAGKGSSPNLLPRIYNTAVAQTTTAVP